MKRKRVLVMITPISYLRIGGVSRFAKDHDWVLTIHDRLGVIPSKLGGTPFTEGGNHKKGGQEGNPAMTLNIGRHENGKRSPNEIGIHSLRYGSEVGTHEIIFSNGLETITIRHDAKNRALFANGALAAAKWLITKAPGLYGMQDFIAG